MGRGKRLSLRPSCIFPAIESRNIKTVASHENCQPRACPFDRLSEFVAKFRREGRVPLPEDGRDMVIAGGPPCQDVSGDQQGRQEARHDARM